VLTFCGQEGGRPYFLVQKTSDFSKFKVCPHGQGKGVIFRDFVRTTLSTAPIISCMYLTFFIFI